MDLSEPASAIVPSLDAVVLAVLTGTTRPLTGRQIHRLARRGSLRGIQLVLNRMTEHGLVGATDAGSARLYVLNRDHVAAPAASALLDLRGQLFDRISNHLVGWGKRPLAAAVYGSAARGDGGTDSDIDLFIVRPARTREDEPVWADAVDDLAQWILRWSGNTAGIVQATRAQVGGFQRTSQHV